MSQDLETAQVLEMNVPERFCVRDDDSANWVIRKIMECRHYSERCAEWCELEQRRAKNQEVFFVMRFGAQLADYVKRKLAEAGGQRKSVSLPAGKIGFRTEPSKIIIEDENYVLEWARKNCPSLIQTQEHIGKSALNDYIRETGDVPISGIKIEPSYEKFFIK